MVGIILIIIAVVAPVAIIGFIMAAVSKKRKDGEEKDFESTVRAIFIYLVLISAFVLIVSASINTFNCFTEIILPDVYEENNYLPKNYDSNIVESDSTRYLKNAQNRNVVGLITSLSALAIGIPLFVYFSKMSKETKNKENE